MHRTVLALVALLVAPVATTSFAQSGAWELNVHGGALRHDVFDGSDVAPNVGAALTRHTAAGWGFGATFDWSRAESDPFPGPADGLVEADADFLRYAFVVDRSFATSPRTRLALGAGVGAATFRFGDVDGFEVESSTDPMVPFGARLTIANRALSPRWGVTFGVRDDVIFMDDRGPGPLGVRDAEVVHHVQGNVGVSLFFGRGGTKVAERARTEPSPVTTPAPAADGPADRETRDRALASVRERIFFDFDRFELKPDSRETLTRKAEALRALPGTGVVIEGHADERGTVEYNLALGERRARAALDYLVDLGIDPERMSVVSYGEERPAVEGANESAWSQNRRDEFVPSES